MAIITTMAMVMARIIPIMWRSRRQIAHTGNPRLTCSINSDFASRYTSEPWQRDLLNKVTTFIHQHINWISVDFIDPATTFEISSPTSKTKRQVRVLDYACGPGTITHALAARATDYIGIDLSENMVQAYNVRFNPNPTNAVNTSSADGAAAQDDKLDETLNAHAVVGNLLDPKDPSPAHLSSPEFFNFDLVVVGLGYHHFQDIPLATKRLVERLRPGGIFLILDFVTHAMEKSSDPAQRQLPTHTVAHAGFSEEELRSYFESAGLTDFAIVKMDGEVLLRGEAKRRPFLARGQKL
ncbi:uncharacterized protein A1O5_04433 [Cladophialophora psammophila CBS 110553]|uniref:Methyltransferase domain-containing protein n=1 Tax=Cladophialophora psammophila CBS 110553 TaxID=1182543 RepID=W9WUS0_9EURO|nr:uncharacterized protein A1O5_04433 [Cladophialophora psammophila CBS 110553]EXJ71932.1 hypothetical protein A1O5_04433 [Cladophialophora psammophila CBS 110553]